MRVIIKLKHTPGNKIINLSGSSVIPDETPMYDTLNNNEVSAKAKVVVPSPYTLRNEIVINSPIQKSSKPCIGVSDKNLASQISDKSPDVTRSGRKVKSKNDI